MTCLSGTEEGRYVTRRHAYIKTKGRRTLLPYVGTKSELKCYAMYTRSPKCACPYPGDLKLFLAPPPNLSVLSEHSTTLFQVCSEMDALGWIESQTNLTNGKNHSSKHVTLR